MKKISTTQLSKIRNIPLPHMWGKLEEVGYIVLTNGERKLTEDGMKMGGEYKNHPQAGQYIAWPEELELEGATQGGLVSATVIGEHFGMPARQINQILSERAWIKKHLKGWLVTLQGKRLGGEQRESSKTGFPFVLWPDQILINKSLLDAIQELKGEDIKTLPDCAPSVDKGTGFRERFPPKLRTADGHYVRSRAEMLIDNWLYTTSLAHAYERRLPIEEEVYCDFYLPAGNVYIEFWGMEEDPKYRERKNAKIGIYGKYDFNLIELNDKDLMSLDDELPKRLLKFGITTY